MTTGSNTYRILHLMPWVVSGGVERRRLELARGLQSDEFEQHIVCIHSNDEMRAAFAEAGVTLVEIGGTWDVFDLKTILALWKYAAAFKPDIIHGAVFEGMAMAAMVGRLYPSPTTFIEETSYATERSWRGDLLLHLLARAATRCITVSHQTRDLICERSRIPADKVTTILNGVSAPTLPEEGSATSFRETYGIPEDAFLIGSVGRLRNEHKRFTDLIEALAISRSKHPSLHLVIVGGGDDLGMLQAHAAAMGVQEHVTFTDYLFHVGPAYAAMDAFALSSRVESFGLVLVEAMYHRLPIVSTRVGGTTQIVDEGETGFFAEPGSVSSIAEAIEQLLNLSPEEREAMGARGIQVANERFSSERYVKDVRSLYLSHIERAT